MIQKINDNIEIYNGDSEEVLKKIRDNSIDCIITSPPYNISKKYSCYDDNLSSEDYFKKMCIIFKECYRVLKEDGRLIVNSAFCMIDKKSKEPKFVFLNLANAIKANGFKDMDVIIWVKGDESFIKNYNYSRGWGSWMSASRPVIRSDSEIIMVFAKNSIKKLRKGESTITKEDFKKYTKNMWYIRNRSNSVHPATYPVELVVNLINLYTYKDDVILDPFVGIGTTLMGCIETGRKCIGIELCEDYYKEAIKNVSNFNVDLFNQNGIIK